MLKRRERSLIRQQMERELQELLRMVETGEPTLAIRDKVWCTACQKWHPRLR